MNTENVFPWKESAQVRSAYEENNYLISETGNATGRAIIFFSSNGIYYPNDENIFAKYVAKGNDGFEWFHLAQHRRIQKYFQKIIFVRDIYKQWYVAGINARMNSVDKVAAFLREEVRGLSVFTCGGSAGGYAAALFGTLLQAENIFVNSAQFVLRPGSGYGPFIEKYATDPERSRYYNLVPLLQNRTNIFYNFPAHCPDDNSQYNYIRDLHGIHILQICSAIHGKTIDGICWPYLLTMDQGRELLYQKYKGSIIDAVVVKKEIVPAGERMLAVLRRIYKKLR